MTIKKVKNEISKKKKFNLSSKNYTMKEVYDAEKLIVGKLEYISSTVTQFGPIAEKTSQKYIFEPVMINGIIKYQEVFTGFIVENNKKRYFDIPYVVDIEKLTDILTDYEQEKIPRLGMLLVLNAVNFQMAKCKNKNILSRKNQNR